MEILQDTSLSAETILISPTIKDGLKCIKDITLNDKFEWRFIMPLIAPTLLNLIEFQVSLGAKTLEDRVEIIIFDERNKTSIKVLTLMKDKSIIENYKETQNV